MAQHLLTDTIKAPLERIDWLFERFIANGGSPQAFDPSSDFTDRFGTPEARQQIPSINTTPAQQIPKNTLVRFRCMVQDTGLEQEMFVAFYEKTNQDTNTKTLHCYRYTEDPIDLPEQADSNALHGDWLSERSVVYCVSPPGETAWRTAYASDHDLSGAMASLNIQQEAPNAAVEAKFPLPGKQHMASVVKFYDAAEPVRVGQLIEVIGVLGWQHAENNDAPGDFESVLATLTKVPVIHAITYRPLDGILASPFSAASLDDMAHQARDIRTKLVEYIATGFGGDKLVAEFVLLQLLSRVTAKSRGLKVGQFTLNVSNFPESAPAPSGTGLTLSNPASQLAASVLEALVLNAVEIPLSVDLLNRLQFFPKSVNESLHAGILQLVNGTLVLVDETQLAEGKLGDTGVRNVQALTNVIQNQTLAYVFPYSQFDFDTDLGVLTLSSGKSMLPNHCAIRLDPVYPLDYPPEDLASFPKETLDFFRMFIQMAKNAEYELPADVSEYIQTVFVNDRKAASEKPGATLPTQDDLMLLVNLTRLVSLSFGEKKVTKESYEYAKRLDKARRDRQPGSPSQPVNS